MVTERKCHRGVGLFVCLYLSRKPDKKRRRHIISLDTCKLHNIEHAAPLFSKGQTYLWGFDFAPSVRLTHSTQKFSRHNVRPRGLNRSQNDRSMALCKCMMKLLQTYNDKRPTSARRFPLILCQECMNRQLCTSTHGPTVSRINRLGCRLMPH